ncbi:response regulator [Neokomagataea tanensis]|uniref:response regulator n=1 Tax=Neokomagataea tanensis TaxID=661191 RepID=UPI0030841078
MRPVSVLIVDDSITARSLMTVALRRDPLITVVGTAATAFEARDMIMALKPDVLTLDVEMPQMNGLEFLEKIMTLRPMPVVMVSSHTRRGADTAIRALEIGAVECYAKSVTRPGHSVYEDLPLVIHRAAKAHIRQTKKGEDVRDFSPIIRNSELHSPLIAIGSSTGGVEALSEVLRRFPVNCPPTVIAQHLPGAFSEGFAKRLDHLCAPKVRLAQHLAPVTQGEIVIAPGGSGIWRLSGVVVRFLRVWWKESQSMGTGHP